jgi:hypothetical protein
MVHALEQIRRLLRPGGLVINVHSLPMPVMVEVHLPDTTEKVGWLLDADDFENERLAFAALTQVVSDGDFNLEDERDFSYRIYADSLPDLQKWLADWWTSAYLPERTLQRIEDFLHETALISKVVIAERARMTKLSSVILNETKGNP